MDGRWDVVYKEHHATIEPHFCRDFEFRNGQEVGCFGTNPDHGYSWDEACDMVAEWYEEQGKHWRNRDSFDCDWYIRQEAEIDETAAPQEGR